MKVLKYIGVALALTIANIGYAAETHLVPFSNVTVKAGSKMYIYYGVSPSSSLVCTSKGKGHTYAGAGGDNGAPMWLATSDNINMSTLETARSGTVRFKAGENYDATVSCEYEEHY